MLTAAKFLVLAAIFLALAWWVGGLPGDVTAHVGTYTITTSTPAALLLLFLIALIFTMLVRVIGGIGGAPGKVAAWRGKKRTAAGERATQRGLVALAAGDAVAAKAEAQRAHKLLGDTPLSLMLRAEAARLAGDLAGAKTAFAQLTKHKEMRFLGHRGLLRASMEEADHNAASRHALDAEDAYPGAAWTRAQRLELALKGTDYIAALKLTQDKNEVAALAVAASTQAPASRDALHYAQMALKAVPGFAPAVASAASALRRLGKIRAARKMISSAWQLKPHPMLGAEWFAGGATPIERAQDATLLAAANPGHVESELVLAQTALDAGLVAEARRHAELALHAGPDDGRAQGILDTLEGKPRTAPRCGWVCAACHHTSQDWSALCPSCGKLGKLRWRTPGTSLV
ncbi:MAG TPA: heme biosynthesis HemY N-terminal domain-containing protein [Acidocella sp.]|jgi:HemY protein|nr:heme biosynthesis HemY N-terminal domain-containing protein [Acidocella sp.]